MNAIRIRKTIDSDTIHLPELGAFIGHTVDIVIQDESLTVPTPAGVVPGVGDWDALLNAAQQLRNYDYDAQPDQDARDIATPSTMFHRNHFFTSRRDESH